MGTASKTAQATAHINASRLGTLMRDTKPLIYLRVCEELGFDPEKMVMVPRPTADQIARGKRVTKKVMGKLNRQQSLPSTGETIQIMDDTTITPDTAEVPVVDPAALRVNGLS